MNILVPIEIVNQEVKKTSLEALVYARKMADILKEGEVHGLVAGKMDVSKLETLGVYGANKIKYLEDERLNKGVITAHCQVIAEQMKSGDYHYLVQAKSPLSEPVAARVAVAVKGSVVSNVIDLPDTSNGFSVKRSIYTGKAFADVEMKGDSKILILKKNAISLEQFDNNAPVETIQFELPEDAFVGTITGEEVASGNILLEEAEYVVSAGRGLKGPENWTMIEDLAKTIKAATACSKPVSDMEWRPHHEHVGQTGIKISPNLYIAVGISGAIQHLAGVNSSKVIVVVNKDPDAPFFKAADYGIVGDAFEVVPKLTEAFKKVLN